MHNIMYNKNIAFKEASDAEILAYTKHVADDLFKLYQSYSQEDLDQKDSYKDSIIEVRKSLSYFGIKGEKQASTVYRFIDEQSQVIENRPFEEVLNRWRADFLASLSAFIEDKEEEMQQESEPSQEISKEFLLKELHKEKEKNRQAQIKLNKLEEKKGKEEQEKIEKMESERLHLLLALQGYKNAD